MGAVSDGNRQWLSIVRGRLVPSCFHVMCFELTDGSKAFGLSKRGLTKINKQMSNLKFVKAMFTSNGMQLHDIGLNWLAGLKGN